MMNKITLILGGARSGKSAYAQKMAQGGRAKVAFIATCMPKDKEMAARIRLHKRARPAGWKTFEDPENIPALLGKIGTSFNIVVIDCLTLWVSGFVLKGNSFISIKKETKSLLRALRKINACSIVVSNEVGQGIVPDNKLARDFRDIAGKVNQLVASQADEVFFMVAGLPLNIKGKAK